MRYKGNHSGHSVTSACGVSDALCRGSRALAERWTSYLCNFLLSVRTGVGQTRWSPAYRIHITLASGDVTNVCASVYCKPWFFPQGVHVGFWWRLQVRRQRKGIWVPGWKLPGLASLSAAPRARLWCSRWGGPGRPQTHVANGFLSQPASPSRTGKTGLKMSNTSEATASR